VIKEKIERWGEKGGGEGKEGKKEIGWNVYKNHIWEIQKKGH
jgi:hypothetical protein